MPASLILASQSPARKALLANTGLAFQTRPAHVDERAIEAEMGAGKADPATLATALADAKARVISTTFPQALVIGSDQLLVLAGDILHKPEGRSGARARIQALSGTTHALVTAVSLWQRAERLFAHVETAHLTMHPLTDAEIDAVLDLEGDAVLGSVGAYRLEGPGIRLFSRIQGDYFSMLGLPLLPLLAALRQHAPHLFAGIPT